jgi:hypothetical protein
MSHPNYRLITLWDMLQLPISRLIASYEILLQLANALLNTPGAGHPTEVRWTSVDDRDYAALKDAANEFRALCATASLTVSYEAMQAVLDSLGKFRRGRAGWQLEGREFEDLEQAIQSLIACVRNETKATVAMVMPAEKLRLFTPKEPPFGHEVDSAFPLSKEDIEESGKCLAMGRSTASVFHLSRAMEAAVQALSAKLGMGNLDREWGKLLSEMKGKIEAMPQGDLRNRWSENHSLLYHVKQAWRNDVMHPKATYTDEQAMEVYQAMRSFMKNLVPLVS